MEKKLKTVNIKGKDYVEVNTRVKEFRTNDLYKGYRLVTEIIDLTNGVVTMKATVLNENGEPVATGHAQEKESSSFINKTSFIENCETSAWGRALGNLGIGIDTSIASSEEVLNAIENQKPKSKKEELDELTETRMSEIKEKRTKEKEEEDKKAVDFDIFSGLASCKTLEELKEFYTANYKKVVDKTAFAELKDTRKQALMEG